MSKVTIKCKWPSGTKALSFESDTSVAEFQALITSITEIPAEYQRIAAGFPPKEVALDASGLASSIIKNGDMIHVTKTDTPQASAAQSSTSKTVSSSAPSSSAAAPEPAKSDEPRVEKEEKVEEKLMRPTPEELEGFESQAEFGTIVRRVMPDDNSCLFHTMAYVLENQKVATQEVLQRLRLMVSKAILADPISYDHATLGKSPAEYARWILQINSWGGAIELSIFSKAYGTEIYALDVTNGVGSCFGENEGFSKRVYVIFDGIHYDAIALSPVTDVMDLDLTEFKPWDQPVEQMALDFLKKEKSAGRFTDTQSFQILCLQCKEVLKGEKGAAVHAMNTGHSQFVEKK